MTPLCNDDLLDTVLRHLDVDDAIQCRTVQRRWHKTIDDIVWEQEIQSMNELMAALRIRPCPRTTMKWIYRRTSPRMVALNTGLKCILCGADTSGICMCPCRVARCTQPHFPWLRVCAGPMLAICTTFIVSALLRLKKP